MPGDKKIEIEYEAVDDTKTQIWPFEAAPDHFREGMPEATFLIYVPAFMTIYPWRAVFPHGNFRREGDGGLVITSAVPTPTFPV